MADIPDSVTKGNPDDKLVIVGISSIGGTVGSSSAYVSKVETFCRLAGIPYEIEFARNLEESPKKTIPYIKHGDVAVADSEFIVEYLTNTYDIQAKPSPDPKTRGIAVAVKRLCEDHLFYGISYYRYGTSQGWKLVYETFFQNLPIPTRWFFPNKIRKGAVEKLYKQGFGRHSMTDIGKLLDSSLQALSQILGENKYITGDQPCPEDASVFAALDNYLQPEIEGIPTIEMVKKYPNLVAYAENMKNMYFPDGNPSKFRRS